MFIKFSSVSGNDKKIGTALTLSADPQTQHITKRFVREANIVHTVSRKLATH